jgi:hypothetical protein
VGTKKQTISDRNAGEKKELHIRTIVVPGSIFVPPIERLIEYTLIYN